MHYIRHILIIASALLLVACLKPYRIDIQQGNLITEKEVGQLKKGMTKREVRYVLGTPLVVDPFHSDRWDYYYSFKPGRGKTTERRRITVVFDGDVLHHMEGDIVSSAGQPLSGEAEAIESGGTVVSAPTEDEEKGLFRRTWEKMRGKDE